MPLLGAAAAGAVGPRPSPVRIVPAAIDAVFKAYTRSTPGCALGIYHDGRIAYAKGYGMADLGFSVPITPATIFDIGSTSKQFAAASIVLLANEGKIALTEDVRKYLPELPDYGTTITIDHLLRHTSGLRDYNGLLYLKGFHFEDFAGDDDALDVIVHQRALNFTPGTRWDYSNTGFFLLSVIVKRVTGKTLAEFAKARLFEPLGMPKTHFRDDHTAVVVGRATAYDPTEKGGFAIDMSDWDQLGDGAVNTNVVELLHWVENFSTGRVGGRALIDRLQARGTLANGDSLSYARGLFVDRYRGLQRIHHSGAWAGYRAMLMRFPEQHLGIATLCNRSDADTQRLAEGVTDLVLAQALEPLAAKAAAAGTSAAPAATSGDRRQVGSYFSEERQEVVAIAEEGGKLALRAFGASIPLRAIGAGRFETERFGISLEFAGDRLELTARGEPRGEFARVEATPMSADQWRQLEGRYHSPELDTDWEIATADGKTVLKARAAGVNPLVPAFRDGFTAGPGFLRFTRDGQGRLTGFDFSASRMQKIRFDRR